MGAARDQGNIRAALLQQHAHMTADRARAIWQLNAFINFGVYDDVENARRIDGLPPEDAGQLAGLPMLVKDNIDVADWPTTAGTPALREHVPQIDASIIRILRREGAVCHGLESPGSDRSDDRVARSVPRNFQRAGHGFRRLRYIDLRIGGSDGCIGE